MFRRGVPMNQKGMPAELDSLFASYRSAVDVPEASPDFMPVLWSRIEQRQRVTYGFRRMASGFVTAAAAICLVISFVLYNPSQSVTGTTATYVEVLADSTDPVAELE